MKIAPLLCCLLFIFTACTKDEANKPDEPPTVSARPKTISINYYRNNELLQTSVYTPLVTDESRLMLLLNDTSYISPSLYTVYKTKTSLTFNPSTHKMVSAVLENNDAALVSVYTDGSIIREPQGQVYNNVKATWMLTSSAVSLGHTQLEEMVAVAQFRDSVQQSLLDQKEFLLTTVVLNGFTEGYELNMNPTLSGDARIDGYLNKRDSLLLQNMNLKPSLYTNLRYEDYFYQEIPWYHFEKYNRAFYSKSLDFMASSFLFQNGYVKAIPVSQFEMRYEFVPTLERNVRYNYTADTAAMKQLVTFFNPGAADPLWYWLDGYRRASTHPPFGEANDFYNLYDWVSSSSTDSVFTINGNLRQFRQAASASNTFERDGYDRIVRITRHVNNQNPCKKVMTIAY